MGCFDHHFPFAHGAEIITSPICVIMEIDEGKRKI